LGLYFSKEQDEPWTKTPKNHLIKQKTPTPHTNVLDSSISCNFSIFIPEIKSELITEE
jgi:hypothetical protein